VDGYRHFVEDMGEKPSKKMWLDRKDNNLGYYPDNCRWVTAKQSANNRTNNVNIFAFGELKSVAEWEQDKRAKYRRDPIIHRIEKGLSPEDAIGNDTIETPKKKQIIWKKGKKYRRRFLYKSSMSLDMTTRWSAFDEIQLVKDWLLDKRCKVSLATIKERVKKGMDLERAMSVKSIPSGKPKKQVICGRLVTWKGKTKNLKEWAKDERCKCSYESLKNRTGRCGWDFERAMTTPIDKRMVSKKYRTE
jgi:hypothetical protein